MRSALTILFALAATSSARVIHGRATPPTGWLTDVLEPYATYHTRYLALGCQTKHETPFFDECCHPLLRNEPLNTRPVQCIPISSSSGNIPTMASPASPTLASTLLSQTSSTAPASTPSNTAPAPAAQLKQATSPQAAAAAVNTGGVATYFFQNGVAGACGTVHQDTDLIAAIDEIRYGDSGKRSSLCGKKVKITNTKNKKSVTVTIADDCPTCENQNSIDLSTAAFQQIASLDQGVVPISWSFV